MTSFKMVIEIPGNLAYFECCKIEKVSQQGVLYKYNLEGGGGAFMKRVYCIEFVSILMYPGVLHRQNINCVLNFILIFILFKQYRWNVSLSNFL